MKQEPLSFQNIEDARSRVDPVFLNSPLLRAEAHGLSIAAKDETTNPIKSFKGRGTSYFLARGVAGGQKLVTASAGNFGQGLAYNASRAGCPLIVFSSVNASPVKIAAMRSFGAEVRLEGDDFDAAKEAARNYAKTQNCPFVEDGALEEIAEGAGTIAVELLEEAGPLDAVIVPLGNGALAAGVGCAIKAMAPQTQVIAVAAKGAPCMALSWQEQKVIETEEADTIADGIAVRIPVPEALDWLRDTIDEIVLVEDADILQAMRFAYDSWGRIVEPAGAAGLAGILKLSARLEGRRVGTILCGGNLTEDQISNWLPAAKAPN
ncbi:MAG: pyridoxal-phosphate dependent enzyme [Rhodobacteraceae bacterium]|nr:pyridoxal-phosphate dependent enzyme [Paracoccaceae bacterium]